MYAEKPFQIEPYVSVRGAHRAKFRQTLARTAHVTCISLADRNLDHQSRKRIAYTYEITIKIRETLTLGFQLATIAATITIRGTSSFARTITDPKFFCFAGSQDIPSVSFAVRVGRRRGDGDSSPGRCFGGWQGSFYSEEVG